MRDFLVATPKHGLCDRLPATWSGTRRPLSASASGRSTLHATFTLDAAELDAIRGALETATATERTYTIQLVDAQGVLHAEIEKLIHIRVKRR
jgi:hypothetical protein